eukprot:TRINITY_DN5439_c0_g1_i1.p1 TRINITY_DN5439_c0_g1~~TRINITY_DN5439_c0_g1_i1.p1  ORF type:complete len:403 (-),score=83.58 TRINITY_DN5439_c0_g1_i1:13-1221(-)
MPGQRAPPCSERARWPESGGLHAAPLFAGAMAMRVADPQQEVYQAALEDDQDSGDVRGAVAQVLSARDHYAALGLSRTASPEALRAAFRAVAGRIDLENSEQPEAREAYDRVKAAWATLSDEDARREYDLELFAEVSDASEEEKDALQAWYDDEQSCASDLEESGTEFFCAEEIVDVDDLSLEECGAGACMEPVLASPKTSLSAASRSGFFADPPSEPEAQVVLQSEKERQRRCTPEVREAAGGFAVSAGIWVSGAAVSAAGLGAVGSTMQRMACAQSVGQVAALPKLPAVQEAVETGAAAVSDGMFQLGSFVGNVVGEASEYALPASAPGTGALEGLRSWLFDAGLRPCVPSVCAEAASPRSPIAAADEAPAGDAAISTPQRAAIAPAGSDGRRVCASDFI